MYIDNKCKIDCVRQFLIDTYISYFETKEVVAAKPPELSLADKVKHAQIKIVEAMTGGEEFDYLEYLVGYLYNSPVHIYKKLPSATYPKGLIRLQYFVDGEQRIIQECDNVGNQTIEYLANDEIAYLSSLYPQLLSA